MDAWGVRFVSISRARIGAIVVGLRIRPRLPNSMKTTGGRKTPVERFLSLFSVVEAGEGATAVLLTLNVFLLLGAYYILKVVRDTLILAESGAEVASYSSAGQAALLLLVVPAYSAFALLRMPRPTATVNPVFGFAG